VILQYMDVSRVLCVSTYVSGNGREQPSCKYMSVGVCKAKKRTSLVAPMPVRRVQLRASPQKYVHASTGKRMAMALCELSAQPP
jgi:hypothetical protein